MDPSKYPWKVAMTSSKQTTYAMVHRGGEDLLSHRVVRMRMVGKIGTLAMLGLVQMGLLLRACCLPYPLIVMGERNCGGNTCWTCTLLYKKTHL